MEQIRANEIVRLTFYRHIDNLVEALKNCDDSEVAFDVGRYVGMMQKDLENELAKEVLSSSEITNELNNDLWKGVISMANIKAMIEDYKMVLKEARDMGCKDIRALYNIPLDNFETIISALEMKDKHETQWLNDINNPLEPLKLSSALQSEIFKLEYRKANKPKEINSLDYTVIYALKDCLERYS